eukprot:TRINITY_DN2343_c0_g1_i8.p1 TRINITY_DN2343_c0_g1~~TRINITY_DN2343_c0_g1_i8.p1  ORF type:complete len:204 (+),score=21.19 TRINITY_DN2343_c0_g1_i8:64-675(+)
MCIRDSRRSPSDLGIRDSVKERQRHNHRVVTYLRNKERSKTIESENMRIMDRLVHIYQRDPVKDGALKDIETMGSPREYERSRGDHSQSKIIRTPIKAKWRKEEILNENRRLAERLIHQMYHIAKFSSLLNAEQHRDNVSSIKQIREDVALYEYQKHNNDKRFKHSPSTTRKHHRDRSFKLEPIKSERETKHNRSFVGMNKYE